MVLPRRRCGFGGTPEFERETTGRGRADQAYAIVRDPVVHVGDRVGIRRPEIAPLAA